MVAGVWAYFNAAEGRDLHVALPEKVVLRHVVFVKHPEGEWDLRPALLFEKNDGEVLATPPWAQALLHRRGSSVRCIPDLNADIPVGQCRPGDSV
jgi:hypothetical protein